MTMRFIPLRHLLALCLMTALLMLPAFVLGPGGGDLHCQSIFTRLFSAQLRGGELYPRWLQDMFGGDGAPVFFYYPPVAYYITALFSFLGAVDFYGYTAIAVSATLAVLVSGIAFYAWMREETGNPEAALVGGLLYMAVPSHLGDAFYGLLLFSTVWAYAWVPMLMLLARRVVGSQPYALVAFAFVLGLLIMTNEPMTLICGPVIVAYGLLALRKEIWVRQVARLGAAIALGFGFSAIYLLPALFYHDYANIDYFWKTGHNHTFNIRYLFFMYYHTTECRIRIGCWYASAVLMLAYLGMVPQKRERLFFFGVFCIGMFMMLPVSAPIWEASTTLKMLQMSERFFVLSSLALCVFASLSVSRLKWLSYALIIACLVLNGVCASLTRIQPDTDEKRNPLLFEAYKQNVDQYGVYLSTPDLLNRYTAEGIAELKAHPEKINVISGDAVAEVKQWQSRRKLIHYKATKDSVLEIRQFDFPGWQASLGYKTLDITRNDDTGRMMLNVPEGEGDITLELTALVPEEAGRMISLICAAALLLMLLLEARKYAGQKV